MNILHFLVSLEVGGLERMVLTLAAEQKRQGHSVTIGCLMGEGSLADEARSAGIPVFSCNKRSGPEIRSLVLIRRALRAARADVLHTHNAVPHYYATAAALGLRLRRIISTRHNMGTLPYSARRESLYRLAMKFTDAGVSVCKAAQNTFVATRVISPEKAVTIVNGVDLERFAPRSDGDRIRIARSLDLPEDAMVMVTVGRLSKVKNHAMMLQALRTSRDHGAKVALIVVGDGPLRTSLEALTTKLGLSDVVRFLGIRHDVAALLGSSDVYLQSSLTEGYSMALVEAAAAQLPILATDVGGNSEIVRDGQTGLLVPLDDVAALSKAIQRLSRDLNERLRMGAAAREWVMESGSLDAMYRSYLNLYEDRPQ